MLGVLYTFRRCPYAMRARLALALCVEAKALELREVVLKAKPAAMLAISPKGTVPVLQLSGGHVLEESLDIMHFALSQNPQLKADIYSSHLCGEMDDLIEQNDGEFKWALDRYKYADRYEEPELFYREKGEVFLGQLESRLIQNRYLFGEQFSLADLAIFPFVRQFAHVNKAWFEQSDYVKLRDWLNAWLESPLFISVMKKYAPWQEGDELVAFP